jgi:hypothetical protein
MRETSTSARGQTSPERDDDDEPGGPSHPAPGHLPPAPEPGAQPERDDDEPGGPSHPTPGYLPPAETGSQRA